MEIGIGKIRTKLMLWEKNYCLNVGQNIFQFWISYAFFFHFWVLECVLSFTSSWLLKTLMILISYQKIITFNFLVSDWSLSVSFSVLALLCYTRALLGNWRKAWGRANRLLFNMPVSLYPASLNVLSFRILDVAMLTIALSSHTFDCLPFLRAFLLGWILFILCLLTRMLD